MKFDLSNKNALVTGGSSGIGKAIAETLKSQGANVYVIDLNEIESNTSQEINTIKTDITRLDDLKDVLKKVPDRVDLLINNAGVGLVGNIEKTEEEDFDRLYKVNVKGVYNCIKTFLPKMKANGGAIINMASIVSQDRKSVV